MIKRRWSKPTARTWLGIASLFLIALIALWILPWRLGTENGASYYSFNLVCDEVSYAGKIQQSIPGTSRLNPVNGVADERIISQFYLEDLCHAVLSLTQIHPITFFWIWRLLFPFVLGFSLLLLARECLPRQRRPWHVRLSLLATAAALPLIYVLYALLLPPPFGHWLHRIPTNMEFPLSILVLVCFVRLQKEPTVSRAVALGGSLLLLGYLRPYAAAPLGAMILPAVAWLALRRQAPWMALLSLLGTLAIGGAPWLLAAAHNREVSTHAEWFARYFKPDRPYFIFERWPVHVGVSLLLALCAAWLRHPYRAVLLCGAAVLAAAPFTCGLFALRVELLHHLDRFGSFYLPLLIMAGLLLLGQRTQAWHGRAGNARSARWVLALSLVSLGASATVGVLNLRYDFAADYVSNHAMLVQEQRYLRAYDWIREHTPDDALFLVDDGADWGAIPGEARSDITAHIWDRIEFFQVIARRKVVYEPRLHGFALSNDDLLDCWKLHHATFGLELDRYTYSWMLNKLRPSHVFWRKTARVPRGPGATLVPFATSIYSDAECEIWKLDFPKPRAAQQNQAE